MALMLSSPQPGLSQRPSSWAVRRERQQFAAAATAKKMELLIEGLIEKMKVQSDAIKSLAEKLDAATELVSTN